MSEPTATTGVIVGLSAMLIAALAPLGLDLASMGAGLCGCVVVRTLLPPPEVISRREIALVTIGSVVFASFATPWVLPSVMKTAAIVGVDVGAVHAKACAAFLGGAFPKPLLLLIQRSFDWLLTQAARRAKP